MITYIIACPAYAAPGAGEGTSSGGDPTHPPRKKRARVDPTVESVSDKTSSTCLHCGRVVVAAHEQDLAKKCTRLLS